ncbi:MAG: hypothetical protein JO257_13695 [Deltaproteobacteria bacterium]|nr:hypothetical protein [Deltaproteobacteria bacterium]
MHKWLCALVIAGCGGHAPRAAGPGGGGEGGEPFAAARFVPANPTYVVAAATVRDGQRAFHDLLDDLGMVGGFTAAEAERELPQILGVDPLSEGAMTNIGVDVGGGMAMFSEDVTPTFVVHMTAPEAFTAFLDQQRQKGLATVSQVVDGVELNTSKLGGGVAIGWALDHDWLFVHFGEKGMGPEWFEHSHKAARAAWHGVWDWAKAHGGKAAVVGFARAKDLVASTLGRVQGGIACVKQLEVIDRVGFSFDVDGSKVGARLTFDLGAAAPAFASHLLPPPPGWQGVAAKAPLQAQWNLDVNAMTAWLEPCMRVATSDPDPFANVKQLGLRSARAIVLAVDPSDKSGAGAVAMDLSSGAFLQGYVDKASHFANDKTFGPYRGHHVSIPFVAKLDYVFDDKLAIAAMGDGVMDRIAAGASGGTPPMFSVSVVPDGMPKDAWVWLLDQIDAPSPKQLVDRFSAWAELHATAALDGSSLVVEVAGVHR